MAFRAGLMADSATFLAEMHMLGHMVHPAMLMPA